MPPDEDQSWKRSRAEHSDRIRLEHMLIAARQAAAFMASRTRADLDQDPMLGRAVLHALQEIGEAASRVSDATRARSPSLPWTQIVGMRHRLVHVYWSVNMDLVFEVIARDLTPLISAVESLTANWSLPPDEPIGETDSD